MWRFLAPVPIWVGLVVAFVLVPYSQPPYHPGPLYAERPSGWLDHADAAANLHILLAQPARFITLPWQITVVAGIQRLRATVGVLGLLQTSYPIFCDQIWGICGAVALLGLVFCRRPVLVTPGVALVNFLFVIFLLAG